MSRIVDPDAMRLQRLAAVECAICGGTSNLSVHHIYPRSQGGDDVPANFADLCCELPGLATTGCHGDVEARVPSALRALGLWVLLSKPDFIEYLAEKLGSLDRALAWMQRNLHVDG